jgi:hypothetical protein
MMVTMMTRRKTVERCFELLRESLLNFFVGCGRRRGRSIIRFYPRKVKREIADSSDRWLLDVYELDPVRLPLDAVQQWVRQLNMIS